MKKTVSLLLSCLMLLTWPLAGAEEAPVLPAPGAQGGVPPELPGGERPEGMPELPDGERPEGMPELPGGERPEGMPGMPGGPGGAVSAPAAYEAVYTVEEDAAFTGEMQSIGDDENALHVASGVAAVTGAAITRASEGSTGGDAASFYGVGAAVLATGGTVVITDSRIETDAAGGAGVFAYGDGVAYVSDTEIATRQSTSGGIHVAGGGTLYAKNLTVTTQGESAAAIRSDRGSGTMVVDGGSYTSHGVGSPAVYVTADISIHDAELTATGAEALCLEGRNTVRLYDCALSGELPDLEQNDNTWTVIVYQSMSGDAQEGRGRFEMVGGTLRSGNGGLFYTTNTESEFVLCGVELEPCADCAYLLRCTGNANQRGWGQTGGNGADCAFTALSQRMEGDVVWDSVSTLNMAVAQGSTLIGAVIDDESCAGQGGGGSCTLNIDETSAWIVTGDSTLTRLNCAGAIRDAEGRDVRVVTPDGTVLRDGDSAYTITAWAYSQEYDAAREGAASAWEEHAVSF